MKTLPETIVERSRLLPEGGMLAAKEFLHLGSRAAVDQALSRLARAGLLIRAARGLYVAPTSGRGQAKVPAMDKVVSSLASKTQELIVGDGAFAAHMLGLAPCAQNEQMFLTSGPNRTLRLGDAKVEIRHAPRWMLSLGHTKAGAVIRALAWGGEKRVKGMMIRLRKRLAPGDWQALSSARYLLPSWMAEVIGHEVARQACSSAEF